VSAITQSDDFQEKCRQLSARIKKRLEVVKPSEARLAAIGTSTEGIRKESFKRYVILGELATVLETTPNWLLGFSADAKHDVIKGLLEAVGQSCGLSLGQATKVAEAALRALDSLAFPSGSISPRDTARIAATLIQQLFSESSSKSQR
jgi:hypothetical protein